MSRARPFTQGPLTKVRPLQLTTAGVVGETTPRARRRHTTYTDDRLSDNIALKKVQQNRKR